MAEKSGNRNTQAARSKASPKEKQTGPRIDPAIILREAAKLEERGLLSVNVAPYLALVAERESPEEFASTWEDIFGLNSYLGRIEGYPRIEEMPFWEYSVFLEWAEDHLLFDDSFDLTLKNARRALGHIRGYLAWLRDNGKVTDTTNIDRAIAEVCGGKKLALVVDIPYTGRETWTAYYVKSEQTRFDMGDFWLLALLEVDFEGDNWIALRNAAHDDAIRGKIDELRLKLGKIGKTSLRDMAFEDLYEHDIKRARDWLSGTK